jgi:hypothetical protein
MKEYASKPTLDSWRDVMGHVKLTQLLVKEAVKEMNNSGSLISTQPFFKDLVGTLMVREQVLEKLLRMPPPKTPEEMQAAIDFFASYDGLIVELEKTGELLRQYVNSLIKKNVYPGRPPL